MVMRVVTIDLGLTPEDALDGIVMAVISLAAETGQRDRLIKRAIRQLEQEVE